MGALGLVGDSVRDHPGRIGPDAAQDIDQMLIDQTLQGVYTEQHAQLQELAAEMEAQRELESALRQETAAARDHLMDNFSGGRVWPAFEATRYSLDANLVVVGSDAGSYSPRESLDDYLDGLESELGHVGDDSQMLQMEIQEAAMRQQMILTVMANLLKASHDTRMAPARNTCLQ